jgi:hypothetical protein
MLKIEALLDEEWVVAKSGVSVDAGRATRIRQEAGCPRDELQARARLISTAPLGYKLALAVLHAHQVADGLHMHVPDSVVQELRALAAQVIAKGEPAAPATGAKRARKEASP